ncbi:amino acid adenylation domain-containing protein [Spartinivicinus ruber]|uniref:amino acid adenylation domain-containing protein n=1 Tax=Spartinivicinus ruber TaxID=2683272 RepID=UPI0013D1E168|nr:amino acid adenylation domain-containing protein [Spartinivicinus ruber]
MQNFTSLRDLVSIGINHNQQRPALISNGTKLNYQEYGQAINQMIVELQKNGLRKGDRVAIALPKSVESLIAVMAAIQLGAVYVPIDISQPGSRAIYIIDNCQCKLVVTSSEWLKKVNKESKLDNSLKWLEVCYEKLSVNQRENFIVSCNVNIVPDDLLCILYTSGSTGNPKGVKITHRNLLNFINWALTTFKVNEQDVFAWHAKLNFDISTFDIFVSLAVGASLVVFDELAMTNPYDLAEKISQHKITVWYSVPSILQLMVKTNVIQYFDCHSLRWILFAGEVFPPKSLRQLTIALPQASFFNLYGPTETNVCTCFSVNVEELDETKPLPIGFCLPNVVAEVYDEWGNRMEEGEKGELVISGPCVTPGYWQINDLIHTRRHANNCHYTGDLVHQIGGCFYYHGRLDNMIKINGHRVELEEIEHVVSQFDEIIEVAVVALNKEETLQLIICYKSESDPIDLIVLKQHCAQYLPKYMIPHKAVKVNQIPLNHNGKIDRRCLVTLLSQPEQRSAATTIALEV